MGSFGTIIATGVWVNTLLIKSVQLEPKTAGMVGSLVLLLGIISRPFGGVILDKKWLTPKRLLVVAHALLALGFIAVAYSDTFLMAFLGIVFIGFVAGLPFAGISISLPTAARRIPAWPWGSSTCSEPGG